jgi:hypothetical protein
MPVKAPKPGRIACEVPFCRRTAPATKHEPGTRIICGKHARLADQKYRRLYRRGVRQGRPAVANYAWEKIRKQAIERSAGVTA